jgi:hypothetical protein
LEEKLKMEKYFRLQAIANSHKIMVPELVLGVVINRFLLMDANPNGG